MKLNEIIQPTVQVLPPIEGNDGTDNFYNSPSEKGTNSGLFSYIEPGDNPFQIKKKSIHPNNDNDDPFFKFATFLMDNDLMNTNPFFPRIYNIKTQNNEDGLRIYDATFEKLQPLSMMSERMQTVMRNMLIDIDMVDNPDHIIWVASNEIGKLKSKYLMMALFGIKESITFSTVYTYIKNSNLKKAIELLIKFLHNNKLYRVDLHSDNFMVRQGNTGYQLVLNDPITSIGDY